MAVAFRLDARERYLLRIVGEADDDEAMADGEGSVVFATLEEMQGRYAARHAIALDEHAMRTVWWSIDSGRAVVSTRSTHLTRSCCWRYGTGATTSQEPAGDSMIEARIVTMCTTLSSTYGNNLPSMTPPGEKFAPDWTAGDLEVLREVILSGVAMVSFARGRIAGGLGRASPRRSDGCTGARNRPRGESR